MLTTLLLLFGVVLGVLAVYELVLMLASLAWLIGRRRASVAPEPRTRFLVAIPAHDEGQLIGDTVRSVLRSRYPAELLDVVVIADNCTDDTADAARAAGATCLERHDPDRRGKPHALHWFFQQYDLSRVSGVAIIDADTVVHPDFMRVMDRRLQAGEVAIQGFYGVKNPDETWLTRLAVLPAAIKFHLCYPGKRLLGLSCPLAGNGMCFDAEILRRFGWNAFTLSEDWEYYLILAAQGYCVTPAPEAMIHAQVANSLRLGRAQRIRWTRGRSQALALHWRSLLQRALRHRDLAALDAIFDVARPTHSMLFLTNVVYLMTCGLLWYADLVTAGPLMLAAGLFGWQVLYYFTGLVIERPPLRTWLALAIVPYYLIWKLSVTVVGLFGIREQPWVKTTRN